MSSSLETRLYNIRTQIQQNVSQVHSNQLQCQRLSARIDQLIEPLERLEHATSLYLRQETRPILDNFLQCLDECNNFIEKFSSEETSEQQNDNEIFEDLHKRLSQFGQDLCLGITIQEIFNQRENHTDLINRTNQIIQQRLQSHRRYLDQKDLIRTKTFLNQQNQFLHIPLKDLRIKEKPIGSGGFADVYKGIWLTHHDQIAIKVLRLNHLTDDFYQEISIMYRIRYEHIVTLLGACIETNFYAMIFEYMPLGSLYDVLHGNNDIITLSWLDRYSLAWQMAKSINYLHNLDPCIIHRDIKSLNFLLKHDGSAQHRFLLKVCDFGLAQIRRECLLQSTSGETVGSFAWKAPELLMSDGMHTKQSDVFSLGMTMWELATGNKPWVEESVIAVLFKIEERLKIPMDIPEEFQQAIEDACNQDPLKRPSCFDLMERMCKQMRIIKEITLAVDDSHCQSTNDTDSTRTAISVSDKQHTSMESDNISINPRLERLLSKSLEDYHQIIFTRLNKLIIQSIK